MVDRNRIQIGLNKKLVEDLDEIGFSERLKSRPKIIFYLVEEYKENRK